MPYTDFLRYKYQISYPVVGRLSKESFQGRGSVKCSVAILFFYDKGLLGPRPTPKLKANPLLAVRGSLFNVFAATPDSWMPLLYPQSEGAPCHDKGPT